MAQRPAKPTKAQVRAALEKQLQDKGGDTAVYQSLLDDYMYYWTMEKNLQADVKHRGLTVMSISAQGKPYEKENPSIKGAALYSKQKLQILKELGLSTSSVISGEDDGGDL